MIKGILSLTVVLSFWFLWAVVGQNPCDRVERGAAPVRAVFQGVYMLASPWGSVENRLSLLDFSVKADQVFRKYLSYQFYGQSLVDICLPIYKTPLLGRPHATLPE